MAVIMNEKDFINKVMSTSIYVRQNPTAISVIYNKKVLPKGKAKIDGREMDLKEVLQYGKSLSQKMQIELLNQLLFTVEDRGFAYMFARTQPFLFAKYICMLHGSFCEPYYGDEDYQLLIARDVIPHLISKAVAEDNKQFRKAYKQKVKSKGQSQVQAQVEHISKIETEIIMQQKIIRDMEQELKKCGAMLSDLEDPQLKPVATVVSNILQNISEHTVMNITEEKIKLMDELNKLRHEILVQFVRQKSEIGTQTEVFMAVESVLCQTDFADNSIQVQKEVLELRHLNKNLQDRLDLVNAKLTEAVNDLANRPTLPLLKELEEEESFNAIGIVMESATDVTRKMLKHSIISSLWDRLIYNIRIDTKDDLIQKSVYVQIKKVAQSLVFKR